MKDSDRRSKPRPNSDGATSALSRTDIGWAVLALLLIVGFSAIVLHWSQSADATRAASASPSTGATSSTTFPPIASTTPVATVALEEGLGCAAAGHSVVVDRFTQSGWLCDDGFIIGRFPITSARSQPDLGSYQVYAEDLNATSYLTGRKSSMTHFVAFTYGKYQGARIAFHSVPTYDDGSYVQPLESVGSPDRLGDSSGCIRVRPDDAVAIWDWLNVGDTVTVIS